MQTSAHRKHSTTMCSLTDLVRSLAASRVTLAARVSPSQDRTRSNCNPAIAGTSLVVPHPIDPIWAINSRTKGITFNDYLNTERFFSCSKSKGLCKTNDGRRVKANGTRPNKPHRSTAAVLPFRSLPGCCSRIFSPDFRRVLRRILKSITSDWKGRWAGGPRQRTCGTAGK